MLRRFAVRALCVLERHEPEFLPQDTILRTLPPSAEAYIVAYAHTAEERDEFVAVDRDARRGISDMQRMVAAYAALLERRLAGFRAADHVDRYETTTDAVAAAQRILVGLASARAASDVDDPIWPELEEALSHAIRGLLASDSEYEDATLRYQSAQTRLRVLGDVLYDEVEALRLRLRSMLGERHDDYRKLGIDGAWLDDEDDDLIAAETVADDLAAVDFDLSPRS